MKLFTKSIPDLDKNLMIRTILFFENNLFTNKLRVCKNSSSGEQRDPHTRRENYTNDKIPFLLNRCTPISIFEFVLRFISCTTDANADEFL